MNYNYTDQRQIKTMLVKVSNNGKKSLTPFIQNLNLAKLCIIYEYIHTYKKGVNEKYKVEKGGDLWARWMMK